MKNFITLLVVAKCSTVIEPVYWNVDNELFLTEYAREVKLQDKMDIFCPQYRSEAEEDDPKTFSDTHHYQRIYMVDFDSYKRCTINNKSRVTRKLANCDKPSEVKKFTMIFQTVNPLMGGLEFKPDSEYYFISTSGESQYDIGNENGGVCKEHQMRLKVKVYRGDDAGVQKIPVTTEETSLPEKWILEDYSKENADEITQMIKPGPDDPSVEKQSSFSNSIIIGAVIGFFIICMIILGVFLTKRIFEKRKGSQSYPTLSDYQSSYEYPPYNREQTQNVYTKSFSPPMSPMGGLLLNNTAKTQNYPADIVGVNRNAQSIQHISEEFAYIEGNRLSNRTNDIVMV